MRDSNRKAMFAKKNKKIDVNTATITKSLHSDLGSYVYTLNVPKKGYLDRVKSSNKIFAKNVLNQRYKSIYGKDLKFEKEYDSKFKIRR